MYASRLGTNTPRRPQAAQAAYLHARVAVAHHKAHGPRRGLSAGSKSYNANVNEFGAALSAFLSSLVARSGYFKSLLHVRLACASGPGAATPLLCGTGAAAAPAARAPHGSLFSIRLPASSTANYGTNQRAGCRQHQRQHEERQRRDERGIRPKAQHVPFADRCRA